MKKRLIDFLNRKDQPLLQFLKYGFCGGLATLADLLVFFALSIWFLPALGVHDKLVHVLGLDVQDLSNEVRSLRFIVNKTLSFLVGNAVAYITNVLWVFESGKHSRKKEFFLFYIVSIVSFLAGTGLGAVMIRFFDFTTTVAFATNLVAAVLINYAGRKYLIFKA